MKVVVVDDHSLFRDGIISLLEAADYEVVGEASNGIEALNVVREAKPNLVLMDISMPKMNGIEALKSIKEESPETQVVMLTVSDSDEDLFESIKFGANGYMLKNLDVENFLDLIRGLENGEAAITRKMATRIMKGFAMASNQEEEPQVNLTPREVELLELVARGLSNKAIAHDIGLSENTIKYHIRNIMKKMGAQNRTEAVMMALRNGLINQKF